MRQRHNDCLIVALSRAIERPVIERHFSLGGGLCQTCRSEGVTDDSGMRPPGALPPPHPWLRSVWPLSRAAIYADEASTDSSFANLLPHLRVFENLQYRFSGCEKKRRQKNLVERFRSEGRDSLVRSLSPRGAHSLVPMRLEGKHAVGVCGSNKKQKLTGPYRGWGKRCPNDGLLLD